MQVQAVAASECLRLFLCAETAVSPWTHQTASRPSSAASKAPTNRAGVQIQNGAAAQGDICAAQLGPTAAACIAADPSSATAPARDRRDADGEDDALDQQPTERDAPASSAHRGGSTWENSSGGLDEATSSGSGAKPGRCGDGRSPAAHVEFLQSEVRRLERRVGQLEHAQASWTQVLQQLLFNTLLDESKVERHRAWLEHKLQKAIALKKDGKVAGVKVVKLRLPRAWQQVPELVLQSSLDDYSKWRVIWPARSVACDLSISGKRLGMPFTCSATLTMGLTGEFESKFVGGTAPSMTMSFLKDPQLQVQTSGTQVSVASMPLPMQEAVDKEIRQHALKALQKSIFPPRTMTFALSAPSSADPSADAAASVSSSRSGAGVAARAQSQSAKRHGASGKAPAGRQSSQSFLGTARADGEAAGKIGAAPAAGTGAKDGAREGGPGARDPPSSIATSPSCSSNCDDSDEDAVVEEEEGRRGRDEALLPAGQVLEDSLGIALTRFKDGGPVILTKVDRGRPAARSGLLRQGDELIEIGMQPVSRARLEVIGALLAWPERLDRKLRLVQLSIHRGRSLLHVNIEQRRPEHLGEPSGVAGGSPPGGGKRAAKEGGAKGLDAIKAGSPAQAAGAAEFASIETAQISAPTNVQRQASVTLDTRTGQLLGVPREWQVAPSLSLARLACRRKKGEGGFAARPAWPAWARVCVCAPSLHVSYQLRGRGPSCRRNLLEQDAPRR